jgi:hypothetical protein
MPFLAIASAVLGVGILAFLVLLFRGAFSAVSDLSQFMAGAHLIAVGEGSQVYVISKLFAAEQAIFPYPARGGVGLFVPPFGLPWLMPLALLPANIAPDVWKLFLIACLALSIFVLRRAFQLNFTATCWLTAFICFSGSTYEGLRIDQVSAPMFLAYCSAIWALKAKRPYLAALALSVFLMKPQQIVPFVMLMIGARQYKTVLGFACIAAVLSAIGLALVGVDGLHNYSALISSCIEDNRYMVPIISCTLRGQLYRVFSSYHDLINMATLIVCCLSYIWYFLIARRLSHSKHWLDYGLVAITPMGIALSPYCLSYDLLPLVPTLLILMTQFEATLPPLAILLGMILTMVFIIPFSIFIHQNWILTGQVLNPQFAVLFIFGIACMTLYYKDLRKRVAV